LEELLKVPLDWDLTGGKPCVLIVHTHATESYKNTGQYTPSDPYRTTEEAHNMLAVGDRLAAILTAGGVSVIHDRTLHDYPTYSTAYTKARETIRKHLESNPNICLVLDLHRDAVDGSNGQLNTSATVDGQPAAQLMLVAGSDGSGYSHPNWQENLALALKLQVVLERENPGLCRHLALRNSRYNQDLSPGMLLVEVGAAGDTRQEAVTAVQALGRGILILSNGAVKEGSTN
jgi:stage II sporulation protein P